MRRLMSIGLWALLLGLPVTTGPVPHVFGPSIAHAADGDATGCEDWDGGVGGGGGAVPPPSLGDPDDPQGSPNSRIAAQPLRVSSVSSGTNLGHGAARFRQSGMGVGIWQMRAMIVALRYYYLRF